MDDTTNYRMLSGIGAAAVLLAAGVIPVVNAPETSTNAVVGVSHDIALASSEVVDSIADAAQAFDIGGLLTAEVQALVALFNTILGLPGTLFNDIEGAITNLFELNFGMAFSDLANVPDDIVQYVIDVPLQVGTTFYEMAAVLPGEFLLNFG